MWPLCYVPALQVHTLPVHQARRPRHGFRTLPASYHRCALYGVGIVSSYNILYIFLFIYFATSSRISTVFDR